MSDSVTRPTTRREHFAFPYVWSWGQPADPRTRRAGIFDRCRKGERCRVVCRSNSMNSALVEFESDGYRAVTSRNGLRRAIV
jgi:hypothetical protein